MEKAQIITGSGMLNSVYLTKIWFGLDPAQAKFCTELNIYLGNNFRALMIKLYMNWNILDYYSWFYERVEWFF